MDPFLEHPHFWSGVHDRLITYIGEQLQPALPAPYYADIADRAIVEVSERSMQPDVSVLRAEQPTPAEQFGGAVSVAVETKPLVVSVPAVTDRDIYVDIYTSQGDRERLVTSIEILSPSNKSRGDTSNLQYRRKQQDILKSPVHLVEIDLLRVGDHTTLVPLSRLIGVAPPFQYHVCVRQFDQPEDYLFYPFTLQDRLPTIAVPLLPGDGSVLLDLQAAFARTYDLGPYRRRVRYELMEIQPALSDAWMDWVRDRLRVAGLLPPIAEVSP